MLVKILAGQVSPGWPEALIAACSVQKTERHCRQQHLGEIDHWVPQILLAVPQRMASSLLLLLTLFLLLFR